MLEPVHIESVPLPKLSLSAQLTNLEVTCEPSTRSSRDHGCLSARPPGPVRALTGCPESGEAVGVCTRAANPGLGLPEAECPHTWRGQDASGRGGGIVGAGCRLEACQKRNEWTGYCQKILPAFGSVILCGNFFLLKNNIGGAPGWLRQCVCDSISRS